MKINVMAAALALALAAPAAHAGCEEITDKNELKACEKKAKAQAKADANTTPLEPSELDPEFKRFDGDDNPFATDAYRVRLGKVGVASVDDYVERATRVQGRVAFAKFIVEEAGLGNAEAISAAPKLADLLGTLPADAEALIVEGKALPESLKADMAPADLMKLPKAVAGLGKAVTALTAAVTETPKVAAAVAKIAASPQAAAGAAATMGAEAAGDAIQEATD